MKKNLFFASSGGANTPPAKKPWSSLQNIRRTMIMLFVMLFSLGAWAATETTPSSNGTNNADINGTSYTIPGVCNPKGTNAVGSFTGLKMRTNQTVTVGENSQEKCFYMNVNEGYKITAVTFYITYNSTAETIANIYVDDELYSSPNEALNAKGGEPKVFELENIEATKQIVIQSTNSQQIFVYASITYELDGADPEPTITFENGNYEIGGADLDLSSLFNSNSSGAVTYSVKTDGGTEAAIDGTIFSATTAGTAVVTASQAAVDGSYAAKSVDANIVVAAPYEVQMPTATLTIGDFPETGWAGKLTPAFYEASEGWYVLNPYELYASKANLKWTDYTNSGSTDMPEYAASSPFPDHSTWTYGGGDSKKKIATANSKAGSLKGPYVYRVTNCIGAALYGASGSNGKRTVYLKAFEVTAGVAATSPVKVASFESSSATVVSISGLSAAKEYVLEISQKNEGSAGSSEGNSSIYAIAFQAPVVNYTISYNANGGSGSMENSTNTISANGFTAPDGKIFAGWNSQADGEGTAYVAGAKANSDLELYAQWAQLYSVTYAAGEGSGTVPTEDSHIAGAKFNAAAQGSMVAPTGKVFAGWKDQDDVDVAEGAEYTMPAKNVILTAQWADPVLSSEKKLLSLKFSNGMDAFIHESDHTVKAYYLNGASAPTIVSHTESDAATYAIDGTTITITAEDATTQEYNLSLVAVDANTVVVAAAADASAFVGDETWIKNGLLEDGNAQGFDGTGLYYVLRRQLKGTDAADDQRVIAGWVRSYIFVGGAVELDLTLANNNKIKYAIDGGAYTESAANAVAIELPDVNNHMIEIVTNQSSGDCRITNYKLVAPAATYTVTYKAGEGTGDDVVVDDATEVADVPGTFTAPAGKVFDTWKDGEANEYAVGAAVTADLTLIAQWKDAPAPVDPEITFNAGNYTVGAAALDLSTLFDSNSAGEVTYSIVDAGETGAAIDGVNFTATAAGTATVRASQAAAAGFNAKTADAVITVAAAPAEVDGIKLVEAGALTGNFRTSATFQNESKTIDGIEYTKYVKLNSRSSWSSQPAGPDAYLLQYTLNKKNARFYYYANNTNGSEQNVKVYVKEEGESVVTINVPVAANTADLVYTDVTVSKNAEVWTSISNTALHIFQAVVVESGDVLPQAGSFGYEINFASGRLSTKSATLTSLDGMSYYLSSDYKIDNSSYVKIATFGTHYINFTLAESTQVEITTNNNRSYYIGTSLDTESDEAKLNETASTKNVVNKHTLSAGTYYISPKSDEVQILKIAFAEPPVAYSVTYDVNGATGDAPSQADAYEGDKFNVASAEGLAKGSMVFDGWKYTPAVGDPVIYAAGDEFTMPAANVEFVAQWADKKVVTFNTNGGSAIAAVNVENGQPVAAPAAPTKELYSFVKWQLEGVDYDFAAAVTADITLDAVWEGLYTAQGSDYVFENNATVGSQTVTTTASPYDAFSIDNVLFSAMTIQYEAGDGGFGGWKIKTQNSTIKFLVENDSRVTVTMGTLSGACKIAYTDLESVAQNENLEVGANVKDVKGGTIITLTPQSNSTVTLKGIKVAAIPVISEDDATLSALSICGVDVDLSSEPYAVEVPFYAVPAEANIVATPTDDDAEVTAIAVAGDKVTVTVTAKDGVTTKDYEVTFSNAAAAYSSSINIEKAILDNSTKFAYADALAAANIVTTGTGFSLDSLNDGKGVYRNNAYLGLKIKNNGSKVTVVLKAGKALNVKLGYITDAINVAINGEAAGTIAANSALDVEPTYALAADAADREVVFTTTTSGTVIFKQIMIDEAIADVVLPEATRHAVVLAAVENGTLAVASPAEYNWLAENVDVTLTVTPDEGYHIGAVTLNGVELIADEGVYAFAMPAAVANVAATFVADAPVGPVYTDVRTGLVSGRYYTMCLDKAVNSVEGAVIWKIVSKTSDVSGIILEEVAMPLEAGRPYFFQATADVLRAEFTGDAVLAAVNDADNNGLVGTLVDINNDLDELNGKYLLKDNQLYLINDGYNVRILAGRAYVDLDEVPAQSAAPAPAPGMRRMAMPIQRGTATGIDAIEVGAELKKVVIDGQLYIVRDGRMYDVTGQLVR